MMQRKHVKIRWSDRVGNGVKSCKKYSSRGKRSKENGWMQWRKNNYFPRESDIVYLA